MTSGILFVCFRDEDGNERLLAIVNLYCPRADPMNEDRKVFKIRFYELLQVRVEAILNTGRYCYLNLFTFDMISMIL